MGSVDGPSHYERRIVPKDSKVGIHPNTCPTLTRQAPSSTSPKILKDLKGYTAKEANRILGRDGTFWEDDYFDCYIRDEEHFRRVVRYIENNPVKAASVRLAVGWPWSSAHYRSQEGTSTKTLAHPTANRIPDIL
jgi:putative DNA methylase